MPWCVKSPAAGLFAQPFVQARIKENIKAQPSAFVKGNHRSLVDSLHKGTVTQKMIPIHDVIVQGLAEMRAQVTNNNHDFMWDAITHSCHVDR